MNNLKASGIPSIDRMVCRYDSVAWAAVLATILVEVAWPLALLTVVVVATSVLIIAHVAIADQRVLDVGIFAPLDRYGV